MSKPPSAAQALLPVTSLLVLGPHTLLHSHPLSQAGRRMQNCFQPVSHTDAQTALLALCKTQHMDEILPTAALLLNMKPQTENMSDTWKSISR